MKVIFLASGAYLCHWRLSGDQVWLQDNKSSGHHKSGKLLTQIISYHIHFYYSYELKDHIWIKRA